MQDQPTTTNGTEPCFALGAPGASFNKVGEFQKADGGTLFLDELGELPLMLQAKVLPLFRCCLYCYVICIFT